VSSSIFENFSSWLERIGNNSPPPEGIVAYNFGLFEGADGYTVYLTGSREYDPEDDRWACSEDYVPAEKYFTLPTSFARKDWRSIQREVALLVRRFLDSPKSASSFFTPSAAITVGFDDGDLERVN
jgi:hypothetical protein